MKALPVPRKCLLPQEAFLVSLGEVWHGHDVLLWHVNPAPCDCILLSADVFNFSCAIKFSDRNNNSSRVGSRRDESFTDPLQLSCCPLYLLDQLQKIRTAASRLVCKAGKCDHIHHVLKTLHWLPVTHRIQYKMSIISFSSIPGTAPQHLSDLLQPYTPSRQLRSVSDTRTFVTPPPPAPV